jgi:FO synthase
MRRVLRRARDGVMLDVTEAATLLAARGDDLLDLMASAARVRDAGLESLGRPGTVTYSRKVFIPLTRLCRDRCHYCTFATAPHKLAAPYLSLDEVLDIARQGAALGCKEALFTLGDNPEDRRRASGLTPPDTTPRWPMSAPPRSRCSRRPACSRISIPES